MKAITTSGWGLSAELVLNTISAPTGLGAMMCWCRFMGHP